MAAFAALAATAANAQWNLRYQGDIELGYSLGIGAQDWDRVNIHTTHGIRFNEYLFAGMGTGVDIYTDGADVAIPLYMAVKGYLPVAERLNLFAGLDMGLSIGVSADMYNGGLLVPQVGIAYKIMDGKALTFAFGFTNQRWSERISGTRFIINTDAITFKVGFQF